MKRNAMLGVLALTAALCLTACGGDREESPEELFGKREPVAAEPAVSSGADPIPGPVSPTQQTDVVWELPENTPARPPETAVPPTPEATDTAPEPAVENAVTEPTVEDFGWIGGEVPGAAAGETDFSRLLGVWNCYVDYRDILAYELNQVTISGTAEAAAVSVRWMWMHYNGEPPMDERSYEPSSFTGSFRDGRLYLTGPGNIESERIWTAGGKQYFVGTLTVPSGETCPFYLVRP